MRNKNTGRLRVVLVAGEYGVLTGRTMTEGLMTLQTLMWLKRRGFNITGNSISICRLNCERSFYEKILQREKQVRDILILQNVGEGIKTEKGRFRKRKLIRTKELVVTAGSDGLFFLIDTKPGEFRVLSLEEARQFLPG